MDKAAKNKWANKDLWDESEFQALCCGLEPNKSRPNTQELNEAIEDIRRAANVAVIPSISPPDMKDGDKFYYKARFFVPSQVLPWASKRFPKFPFTLEDISPVVTNGEKMGDGARDTLLKMIGILALALSEKAPKFQIGGEPNGVQISNEVLALLEKNNGFNKHGLSYSNLREKISEGLALLTRK